MTWKVLFIGVPGYNGYENPPYMKDKAGLGFWLEALVNAIWFYTLRQYLQTRLPANFKYPNLKFEQIQ